MSILTLDTLHDGILAAQKAQKIWASKPMTERENVLKNYKEVLARRSEEMAALIAQETGKPMWESKTEVTAMINKVDITIASAYDRCAPSKKVVENVTYETVYKPHGVVSVIGPFNFPGHLPNGHIIPALLMGNAIIFKPSEFTEGVGKLLVACLEEAGIDKDLVGFITGGKHVGEQLVLHPSIKGVLFTGSYNVGLQIKRALLEYPDKILALEMGGLNSLIIENYASLDEAVTVALKSAFLTSGQRCTCARRIIVIESDQTKGFVDSFCQRAEEIKIGPEDGTFYGAMINEKAAQHVVQEAESLIQAGAVPLCFDKKALFKHEASRESDARDENMARHNESPAYRNERKAFLKPIVLDVTHIQEKLKDEEVFGPMAQIIRVPDLSSAIQVANHTGFGLSLSILSDNKTSYDRVFAECRAGLIHWNMPTNGASSAMPFGGVGKSGNFRPSAYFAVDYCCYPVATIKKASL